MIPKEVLQQIRRIQITTSRVVTDVFAGQYQSVFKGKGMEFEEVREYQPGDDIRSIDWNVTARMGHLFVKKFVEERELTVMLLMDMSRSSYFGTVNKLKRHLAAELCAVLALSAVSNNDKVGFIGFTNRIEKFVPPRKGMRHVLRVIREALFFNPQGKGTDISVALEYLNRVTTRRTVTFLLSDFYAPEFKQQLAIANKRHDMVAISITDPREKELPAVGIIAVEDAETGEQYLIDTSDAALRQRYAASALAHFEQREHLFKSINVDHIGIYTNIPYMKSLFTFFRAREKRLR